MSLHSMLSYVVGIQWTTLRFLLLQLSISVGSVICDWHYNKTNYVAQYRISSLLNEASKWVLSKNIEV